MEDKTTKELDHIGDNFGATWLVKAVIMGEIE